MNWPSITGAVVILAVVSLSLYDVLALNRGGLQATISYQVMEAGYHWPIIAFAVGILCGHFFWRIGGAN